MFVLRSLFWFAVVALMMPQGPDLGLDLSHLRSDIAAHRQSISFEAIGPSQWRVTAPPLLHDDPVASFRAAALSRLAVLRTELSRADAGPRVGEAFRQLSGHVPY